jgi:tetratricopeptide (TPR) repeat protein
MLTLYALGLMSKPMLVTLPLLMLLLDYWPLTRWGSRGLPPARLLREKLPFFLMAAASCVVTLAAQQSAGAVMKLEGYPIGLRFANAAVSYFRYLGKMIWPARLALPYPYPDSGYEWWVVAGTILALAAISWAAVRLARSAPYLLAGWIWYLVSLVPVIGLVQVGGQAMADRYTYIPLIGPLIAAAWGVPACADRIARRLARPGAFRLGIAAAGLTVVAACSVLTRVQTGYWRNGITLFTHSLAVTDRNYLGHNHLGVAWDAAGDPDRAAGEYREALEIAPDYALAHYNLGRVLAEKGDIAGAIAELQDSIRLFPGYYRAYHNLGYALGKTGRIEEALDAYKSAIRLEPRSGESHYNLAIMLYAKGRYAAAWEEILLARRYGYSPLPEFLKALEAKMPPPDQPRK